MGNDLRWKPEEAEKEKMHKSNESLIIHLGQIMKKLQPVTDSYPEVNKKIVPIFLNPLFCIGV